MMLKNLMIAATVAALAATGAVAQDAMAKKDATATDHMAMGKKMLPAEKKKHDATTKTDAMAHDAMKPSTRQ